MLRLHNVRKCYGALVAVDDLSLELRAGEVFGLLGPNGAGKSTTVNLAVGLLKPDKGDVSLNGGGSPLDPDVRGRIGVAPQALALYEELTGEENLRFFARLQRLSPPRLDERVRDVLALVGLTDRAGDRVRKYSGGMKRRLNLAVALVHDPPMLLLDEPTVGVDPQSRNAIFENILQLKREGRSIVYTTHYMEEAQRLCDRVGIIDRGKLLALDTVDNLIAAHGGKSVIRVERAEGEQRIDTDRPMEELARLAHDADVLRFSVDRPDLESVFLNLTGRHLRD